MLCTNHTLSVTNTTSPYCHVPAMSHARLAKVCMARSNMVSGWTCMDDLSIGNPTEAARRLDS